MVRAVMAEGWVAAGVAAGLVVGFVAWLPLLQAPRNRSPRLLIESKRALDDRITLSP